MSERDRKNLLAFLASLYRVLDDVIRRRRLPAVPPGYEKRVELAWQDLLDSEAFLRTEGLISVGEFDRALSDHGLAGPQLDLKLDAYAVALGNYNQASAPRRFRRLFGRRRAKRLFRWLLRVADLTLGSLAAVVPPAGAIAEFKETIEALMSPDGPARRRGFHPWGGAPPSPDREETDENGPKVP